MSTDLRKPGTDPNIHDRGDQTPVGFIQHANLGHPGCAAHVEAVAVIPVKDGKWQHDHPEGRLRVVVGPRNGEGWAGGHADLTKDEARQLIRDLQEQVRKL